MINGLASPRGPGKRHLTQNKLEIYITQLMALPYIFFKVIYIYMVQESQIVVDTYWLV